MLTQQGCVGAVHSMQSPRTKRPTTLRRKPGFIRSGSYLTPPDDKIDHVMRGIQDAHGSRLGRKQ